MQYTYLWKMNKVCFDETLAQYLCLFRMKRASAGSFEMQADEEFPRKMIQIHASSTQNTAIHAYV